MTTPATTPAATSTAADRRRPVEGVPQPVLEPVVAATTERARAQAAEDQAERHLYDTIRAAVARGVPVREVNVAAGLSASRVYQILDLPSGQPDGAPEGAPEGATGETGTRRSGRRTVRAAHSDPAALRQALLERVRALEQVSAAAQARAERAEERRQTEQAQAEAMRQARAAGTTAADLVAATGLGPVTVYNTIRPPQ